MRKLLPYLRLRTLTQDQASALTESCIDPLEKLALLQDLCSKSKKRKSSDALPDPFSNSLKKRVQMYTDSMCTIIPSNLISCDVDDLAFKDKHRMLLKSSINYVDIVLKKGIYLTQLHCLSKIDDAPRIEYRPEDGNYQNVPKEKTYQSQVINQKFD